MTTKNDDFLARSEVRIERTFDAPPERVYRAWTEPATMARWMWAGMGGEPWAESDLRVGGAYRVYTKAPGGTHQGEGWSGMCGLYVEIQPGARLVYTVHWDADVFYNAPGNLTLDEVVIVTFAPEGAGTRMVFAHMGVPADDQCVEAHRQGIAYTFDALAKLLVEGS